MKELKKKCSTQEEEVEQVLIIHEPKLKHIDNKYL
jgi:hypothetical protein